MKWIVCDEILGVSTDVKPVVVVLDIVDTLKMAIVFNQRWLRSTTLLARQRVHRMTKYTVSSLHQYELAHRDYLLLCSNQETIPINY